MSYWEARGPATWTGPTRRSECGSSPGRSSTACLHEGHKLRVAHAASADRNVVSGRSAAILGAAINNRAYHDDPEPICCGQQALSGLPHLVPCAEPNRLALRA